jgi:hypothetical protein
MLVPVEGGSDRLHCQESSVFLSNKFCSFLLQKKLDLKRKLFSKCKSDFYLGKHRQFSDVTKFEFFFKTLQESSKTRTHNLTKAMI